MTGIPPHRDRLVAWTQQVRHVSALKTVLSCFDRAEIPALPVKGIVSARTLYPDVAERLVTDVDLRILPRDFERVLAEGRRAGWRVVQRMRSYCNVVFIVDGVFIDIEGYPALPGLGRLTVETMLARARPSDALGFSHLFPDFHDHAVVLLINVFKDKLIHAFQWTVRDLERLPAHPQFDGEKLVSRLREAGACTIGWIVADWMVRQRHATRWSEVRDAIGRRAPRARYAALLAWLRDVRPQGTFALRVLTRAGADDPRDRARALSRMLFWQTEAWASRWSDAPYRRQDPSVLEGTILDETRVPSDEVERRSGDQRFE
jgi:hypothetical protein